MVMKDVLIKSQTGTHFVIAIYVVDEKKETPPNTPDSYYNRIYRQTEAQIADILEKHPQATRMK
jgi:hypothetical protein